MGEPLFVLDAAQVSVGGKQVMLFVLPRPLPGDTCQALQPELPTRAHRVALFGEHDGGEALEELGGRGAARSLPGAASWSCRYRGVRSRSRAGSNCRCSPAVVSRIDSNSLVRDAEGSRPVRRR